MTWCVTDLTCIHCGASFPGVNLMTAEATWMTCPHCGPADGVLDISYDLNRVRGAWSANPLANRPLNHWRYAELLPLSQMAIRHDWQVGWTPVVDAGRLARQLNIKQLLLKDEGRNPTASFKDRASSVGVAHALQVGATTVACASTGNAASSLAGHAALAGLPAYIFVPATAPEPKIAQLQVFGATVFAVKASYDAAYDLCSRACHEFGWYNRNCAVNPVLVEGKKTAGLEVAEQSASFGGVPDWVAVSVGDGCTIAGIWKGLIQMKELGVIDRLPRLLAAQAEHVNPIEYALEHDALPKDAEGTTIADSINVHVPRNWRKAIHAIHEADGVVVTASDEAILNAMRLCGQHGVYAEPAAAAALAGVIGAIDSKTISPNDRVLVMITGSGLKDTKNAIRAGGQPTAIEPSVAAVADALKVSRKAQRRRVHNLYSPAASAPLREILYLGFGKKMQVDEKVLKRTIERFRERKILLPTFAQMRDPSSVPQKIRQRLKNVGLWDVDPVNLFRITWKNEPVERGGLYNQGNWIEFPPELTGVDTRIIGLVGKFFPTGAHKVGAAFGCLVPKLVSGQFDPTQHKAVWPSTGNYCRGGAFDSALVGCTAVAILPEEMSRERFAWLKDIGAEVIATPGCESNVKEIYDKCWEIRRTRPDCVIFNQFEEFGNSAWHYHVTGKTIEEIFNWIGGGSRLSGYVSATGSAGTIAAGDYLRTVHPQLRVVATEALQCPTLYQLGFGGHRIEGIGDKHVPWIHNVRNTDMVAAIDDQQCLSLLRLFNDPHGQTLLNHRLPDQLIQQLQLIGISGICNLVAAIKTAKYYDMDGRDVIFTCLTDSAGLYASRLDELAANLGPYTAERAAYDQARYLDGIETDHLRELTYHDRKALHNFKYFTWVEQQGRTADELRELWNPDFWDRMFSQVDEWDEQIAAFNGALVF